MYSREVLLGGRVAVVTGAASGIGAAVALELGQTCAHTVLVDLPGSDMSGLCERISAAGGRPIAQPADIRDFATLEALARDTQAAAGSVDILVASAGIEEQSTIVSGDPNAWHEVVDTNLLGTAQTVRAFLPTMLRQATGDIVLIGSTSGRETPVGNPIYAATKWGTVGLARALRHELAARRSRLRVTLIDPGLVNTPLSRKIEALSERLEAGHALATEDIARLIAFVVTQPPSVLLSEIRVEPVLADVAPTTIRRAGNRLINLLGG